MNILFFGSDKLLARVRNQAVGQSWDIHRAKDPDQVLDYKDSQSFQAAIFGLCGSGHVVRAAVRNAKNALDIPASIGLAAQKDVAKSSERSIPGLDIVVPECGNDSLTKQQCDAVVRLANGARSECVSLGGVSFYTSENRFSVNGQEIQLPQKKHKLLELLFLKRGRIVTKEMVFNHLYGWNEPPEAKIIDVFVCQIRRALREAGLEHDFIQTVWGQGYRVPDTFDTQIRSAA